MHHHARTTMHEPRTTLPAKCSNCNTALEFPVVCRSCRTLIFPQGQLNHFELFNLDQQFDLDLDELKKKFLALSRSVHPDTYGNHGKEMQNLSVRLSAELNKAYDTLNDPIRRAEYLLHLWGGPSRAEDKSVPENFLAEVMMLREEIQECREAGNDEGVNSLIAQITQRRQAAVDRIVQLAGRLCGDDATAKSALRESLNCMKYWDTLLEQVK